MEDSDFENKSLRNRVAELESYSAALAKTNDELREKIAKAIGHLVKKNVTHSMSAQLAFEVLSDSESQKLFQFEKE